MSVSKDVALKKQLQDQVEKYSDKDGELDQAGQDRLTYLIADGMDYTKYDLDLRQILFCMYYVYDAGFSAVKAAKMAGYTDSYANTAGSWIAGKNARPNLQAFISDLTSEFGASKTQILAFLTKLMERDFWDVATGIVDDPSVPEGYITYFDWKRLKETGYTSMIQEITYYPDRSVKTVKLYDALKATELLGQTHAMFKKSVEIRNLNDALADADIEQTEAQSVKERFKERMKELKRQKKELDAEKRLSASKS